MSLFRENLATRINNLHTEADEDVENTLLALMSEEKERMLRYFRFKHLPKREMRETSRRFCILAIWLVMQIDGGPERTAALRKLLESKDAAVRAMMDMLEGAA